MGAAETVDPISREAEKPPKQVLGYRPYLLAFCASWVCNLSIYTIPRSIPLTRPQASAMYGYDSAFIGGTLNLPSFQARYGLDEASKSATANLSSNIVSTFQGGAFFGSAMGCLFAERFGRKPMLMLAAVIFTIGAGLQLVGTLPCLYVGRVLTGWGVGANAMILPVYVSECSPAQIRGRLVGVFEIMLQLALVCGFWVNYGVNRNVSPIGDKQWHIPVAVQLADLLLVQLVRL